VTATLEQTSNVAETVLQTMRRRRVVRSFTDEPVSEADLRMILESARWALSAGN
jgi:nitroreductase